MKSLDPLTRPLAEHAYTGVGSRQTPRDVLALMEQIALKLASDSPFVLRSGGADGADAAFARGAGDRAEIYLPWRSFAPGQHEHAHIMVTGDDPDARTIAAATHPAWERVTRGGRALHTRNVHQVLGRDLDQPSDFMLCWTPTGLATGGTGTAIKLALANRVIVYNLHNDSVRRDWIDWVHDRDAPTVATLFAVIENHPRAPRPAPRKPPTAPRTVWEMTEADAYWKSLIDADPSR